MFHVGRIPKSSGIEYMVATKVFFLCILQISKFQRRAVSSEIIKLDRVLTLNSSSLKQNLVISVCFNYAQVLPKFCTFRYYLNVQNSHNREILNIVSTKCPAYRVVKQTLKPRA